MKRNHANRTIRARLKPTESKAVDRALVRLKVKESDLVRKGVFALIQHES